MRKFCFLIESKLDYPRQGHFVIQSWPFLILGLWVVSFWYITHLILLNYLYSLPGNNGQNLPSSAQMHPAWSGAELKSKLGNNHWEILRRSQDKRKQALLMIMQLRWVLCKLNNLETSKKHSWNTLELHLKHPFKTNATPLNWAPSSLLELILATKN